MLQDRLEQVQLCHVHLFHTITVCRDREIYPEEYEALRLDEKILGFTLDNKKCLDDFVGKAESCVYWKDRAAVRSDR